MSVDTAALVLAFLLGIVVNVLAVGIAWGSMTARIKALEHKLDNGYTCKYHCDTIQDIARLQGESEIK